MNNSSYIFLFFGLFFVLFLRGKPLKNHAFIFW